MLSWKYKLIGLGYNNNKLIIMKFSNTKEKIANITYNKYIIDINTNLNNSNIDIKQIKCIDNTNKKIKEKNNIEYSLLTIFSINNSFFIYNIISDYAKLNINFINKLVLKQDINYFDIINKNWIIFSFLNSYKIEIILLENNEKEEKGKKIKEILFDNDSIEDNINKIIFTCNKKGLFLISNNSIKYLEFI